MLPTTTMMLTTEAFAKVNLTLEVYGRRPDGYHALRSVVLPVSLADTLTFESIRAGETPPARLVTDTGYGERDLIVKAADVLASEVLRSGRVTQRKDLPPYAVRVTKRIPAGGGLGGGSADASAALRALNRLWGVRLPLEELVRLGAEVGSDVPALVLAQETRHPVWMEGRGERVEGVSAERPLPAGALPARNLVLANPGVAASTPEVFAQARPRTAPTDAIVNDLTDAACRLHPEIAGAMEKLRAAGARDVRMSGSGATVFGFAPTADAAEAIAADVRQAGCSAWAAEALSSDKGGEG